MARKRWCRPGRCGHCKSLETGPQELRRCRVCELEGWIDGYEEEIDGLKAILEKVVKECTRCKDGEILHATSEKDASTKVHRRPCPCCAGARKRLEE